MAWIDGYHEPEKVVSTKIVSFSMPSLIREALSV